MYRHRVHRKENIMNYTELAVFAAYFLFMLGIGIFFFLRSKDAGEKDYFLGGRQMGAWVSALSAGASDMSAWVLMGLPASIYAAGLGQVWIAIGLGLGYAASWIFEAPRLRRFSIAANDSITIPQYLTNRFKTSNKTLQIMCAVIFLVAYTIYAASSIKACGTLFNIVMNIDATVAMYIAAAIIISYTFLGGFSAVCWTDFFQGLLMLAALLIAPIFAMGLISAGQGAANVQLPANYWNLFANWKDIVSGLGWGLGYFGMPHILIRYFSIKNEKEMRKSQIIGCTWFILIIIATTATGLVGRQLLGDKLTGSDDQSTLVFIDMVRNVFNWIGNNIGLITIAVFCAGILLSAILAAAMSTADSQLLASASAFASDIYKPLWRKNASDREMLWAGRLVVLAIAVVAYFIASSPNCKGLMGLVSCAWGAFGAAFGPVILAALFWKRLTYAGALAGIIAGFAVDIAWYIFMPWTGIYEIIPGFAAGILCLTIVSLLTAAPSAEVVEKFEAAKKLRD